MSQFRTFELPSESDVASEGPLNAFLRSHRIVSVAKTYDAGTWRFCVEWLDGTTGDTPGRSLKYAERVDYMKVLSPEVFAVFAAPKKLCFGGQIRRSRTRRVRKHPRGRPLPGQGASDAPIEAEWERLEAADGRRLIDLEVPQSPRGIPRRCVYLN